MMNITTRVILSKHEKGYEFIVFRNNDNEKVNFQATYFDDFLIAELKNPLASLLDELGILEKAFMRKGLFEMLIDFNVKIENKELIEMSITIDNQMYYQEKVSSAKVSYLDNALFHKVGWLFFEGPYEYQGNIDNETLSILNRYFMSSKTHDLYFEQVKTKH